MPCLEMQRAQLTDVAPDLRPLTQDLDPLVPADSDRRAGEISLAPEHAAGRVRRFRALHDGASGLGLAFGPRQAECTDKNQNFDHDWALRSKWAAQFSVGAVKEP